METVYIEPTRRHYVPSDDSDWYKLEQSENRRAMMDRIAMEGTVGPVQIVPPPNRPFKPTVSMLKGLGLFPSREDEPHCPAFNADHKLPSISQLIMDNLLPDKPIGDIEHEMREADRTTAHRLFDRSGNFR